MLKELDFTPCAGGGMMRMRRNGAVRTLSAGFTMMELVVTLLIVGVLTAIAIPALKPTSTVSEANSLYGSLQFARSAAVRQGQTVIVCPSSNPTGTTPTCTLGPSWSTGWIVLIPANGLCTVATTTGSASGDQVIQRQQAFTGSDTAAFSVIGTNTNTAFCFSRLGFSTSTNTGIVTFKSSPAVTAKQRCTILSGVGHVQVVSQGQSDALGTSCS